MEEEFTKIRHFSVGFGLPTAVKASATYLTTVFISLFCSNKWLPFSQLCFEKGEKKIGIKCDLNGIINTSHKQPFNK